MNDKEFYYYLLDCAEEVTPDRSMSGGDGQFTGGFYTREFKVGNIVYEIGLDIKDTEYCELVGKRYE